MSTLEQSRIGISTYWKCVLAAVPELAVGFQFLLAAQGHQYASTASRTALTSLMQVEFLVIHSMAFLGLLALWRPATPEQGKLRTWAFWGLFALYAAVALSMGIGHVVTFLLLTFVTYLGLFLNWRSESVMLQLGARWIVAVLVFLLTLQITGAPEDVGRWDGRSSVVLAGALYFFTLAAVELSGLYLRVIPRHADAIMKALRQAKQR